MSAEGEHAVRRCKLAVELLRETYVEADRAGEELLRDAIREAGQILSSALSVMEPGER